MRNQRGDSNLDYLALSSYANFVYMHEQLRDIGRSIFRPFDEKIELCRGVWQSDDVDDLLAKYEGAISLEFYRSTPGVVLLKIVQSWLDGRRLPALLIQAFIPSSDCMFQRKSQDTTSLSGK